MTPPLLVSLLAAAALVLQVRPERPGPLSQPGAWFGAPEDFAWLGLWLLAALGAAWATRARARLPLAVLGAGLALRLLALGLPPVLSDDVFRYLWEGHVQLAGLDPFSHPPGAEALLPLRDAVWAQVNHKEVSTIYPPGALWLFRGVAALLYEPLGWKLLSGAADLGVLLSLAALCRERGVAAWAPTLYALHPLPVLESAGSGHLESPALLCLTLALLASGRGRGSLAVFAASAGALIKLLPAAALLPLLRRHRARALPGLVGASALALALSLPFLEAGVTLTRGFQRYYEAWSFNSALFPWLEAWMGSPAEGRALGVALGAAWCALAAWRRRDPAAFCLDVAAALLLLSPVVHPWYVLWALVPALALGAWPWAVLASTCLLSYVVLGGYDRFTGTGWEEPWWLNEAVYIPLALSLAWWALQRRRSPGSPSSEGPSPSPSPT